MSMMSKRQIAVIVRPITDDGLVGFNKSGNLIHCMLDGEYQVTVGIADVRLQTCIICGHGWQETATSLGDQCWWDLAKSHVHRTCLIRYEGLREREDFWSAIVGAKVRFGGLVPIPNRYWPASDPWAAKPWYQAELLDYPAKLVLGARKRVFNIEVIAQGGIELSWWEAAREAFKDEDVTKEFSRAQVLLHAWGTEKMKEYLKKISQISGYDKQIEDK
jgi:hypothetical protein